MDWALEIVDEGLISFGPEGFNAEDDVQVVQTSLGDANIASVLAGLLPPWQSL